MEQLTIDGNPVEKTINLRCFRVDDHDYYAAADEAEAEAPAADEAPAEDDEKPAKAKKAKAEAKDEKPAKEKKAKKAKDSED